MGRTRRRPEERRATADASYATPDAPHRRPLSMEQPAVRVVKWPGTGLSESLLASSAPPPRCW